VCEARDTRPDRLVAIKFSKSQFTKRFDREARFVAALHHPHVCRLYDVGPDYLVFEYIDGSPAKGPMSAADAVRVAAQIAEALERPPRTERQISDLAFPFTGIATFRKEENVPTADRTATRRLTSNTPGTGSPFMTRGKHGR
jgi:hypothetical protein